MVITDARLPLVIALFACAAPGVARAQSAATPSPCVLRFSASAEVVTREGRKLIPHSEHGDPRRDCVGIRILEGSVDVTVYSDDGDGRTFTLKPPGTLTAAMLAPTPDGARGASRLSVFWEILTGSSGEAQGYSRGPETAAATLSRYLNGALLFDAGARVVDLQPITGAAIEEFAVVTNDARHRPIAGVTLTDGRLRIAPDSLEAGRAYRWTARVDGVEVSGVMQVATAATSARLMTAPTSTESRVQQAIRLAEAGYRLDALAAAQRSLDDRKGDER